MFLSLELPGGDKGVSIFARDLADPERYEPYGHSDWQSDRGRADRAITGANQALGKTTPGGFPGKAFGMLFNQFNWQGTTGWEYWSRDYQLMLKHALLTAAALKVPLHVHTNCMDAVMTAALLEGIKFDFDVAKPIEKPNDRDFVYINRQIEQGEFFVLTDVVLPATMPAPPQIDFD